MKWWVFTIVLIAANEQVPTVTLKQAITAAIEHQPWLKIYRQQTQQAQAQQLQTQAINYPELSLTAQILATTNNASSASFWTIEDMPRLVGSASSSGLPTAKHPQFSPRLNNFLGLSAHYRLLDFGQTYHQQAAVREHRQAASNFEQQAVQDVIFRVSLAYLQLVAVSMQLRISQDMQLRAQKHHHLAESGVKNGLRPAIDKLRSAAELAAADLEVIQMTAALHIHQGRLNTMIGWGSKVFAVPLFQVPYPLQSCNSNSLNQNTLNQRQEFKGYEAKIRAAQHRFKAAFALNFPQITVAASMTTTGVDREQQAFNWGTGFIFTLPLFQGFAINGQKDMARAQLAALQAQSQVLQNDLHQQLDEAFNNLLSAKDAIETATIQSQSAHAVLEQAETRYQENLGNIVELVDAQQQLTTAQKAVVQNQLLQATSYIQCQYISGNLP